jgi:hypothetical protein
MAPRKPKKTEENPYIFQEYNSLNEIANAFEETPVENNSRYYYKPHFCPFSFDETLNSLRHGWHDGNREIHAITEKINTGSMLAPGGYETVYDVTGDFIDIAAYLEGVPECMGSIIPLHVMRDAVTIVVNASASSVISERSIRTRGAAITALIERLQDTHDVNLIVGINSEGTNHGEPGGLEIAWHINLQNEFSRDLVAFAVAHPGFLRRVYFALAEQAFHTTFCKGYGSVKELEQTLSALKGQKYYYFSANHDENCWNSTGAATARVTEIMREITG